jgi:uncharacterized membrane protein
MHAAPAPPDPVTRPDAPLAEADGVVFDAYLHPHRSLSGGGFLVLMAVLVTASLVMGLTFLALGAWPVFGLYGVDVLLVWLAFRANYRSAARLWERVQLTPSKLTVDRYGPRAGQHGRWHFQPTWLRVQMDDPPEHDSHIVLTSHGRSLRVGSFLAPEQRQAFAQALRDALASLRTWGRA